jgi:hypothetical protein
MVRVLWLAALVAPCAPYFVDAPPPPEIEQQSKIGAFPHLQGFHQAGLPGVLQQWVAQAGFP